MTPPDQIRELELCHAYQQGRIDALRELAEQYARQAIIEDRKRRDAS